MCVCGGFVVPQLRAASINGLMLTVSPLPIFDLFITEKEQIAPVRVCGVYTVRCSVRRLTRELRIAHTKQNTVRLIDWASLSLSHASAH